MKPYIEHNGVVYEFEANFTLKREYDREYQNCLRNSILEEGLTAEQYNEFKEISDYVEKNKEEGFDKLSKEQKEKLANMINIVDKFSYLDLYDKYCYKMLNDKYKMTRQQYELMLEGLAEEYGISFVDKFIQKVCDKVFTQQVEKKQNKKPLPEWMN